MKIMYILEVYFDYMLPKFQMIPMVFDCFRAIFLSDVFFCNQESLTLEMKSAAFLKVRYVEKRWLRPFELGFLAENLTQELNTIWLYYAKFLSNYRKILPFDSVFLGFRSFFVTRYLKSFCVWISSYTLTLQ